MGPDGWRSVSTVAQIKLKGEEAWAIQTDVTDGCMIERCLLVHRLQRVLCMVAI